MHVTHPQNPVTKDEIAFSLPVPKFRGDALVFATRLPAGAAGSPPHRHAHLTESFGVLECAVTVRIAATDHLLTEGRRVTIRPNRVHGFHNDTAEPALLKCKVTPVAGFERFLRGMQAAAEAGHVTRAGLPRDSRRLGRLLLDADFHDPLLPMRLQRRLFRLLTAPSPA